MFHRVDDWRALDGRSYFVFAERLAFYRGAMHAHVMAAIAEEREAHPEGTTVVSDSAMLAQLQSDGELEYHREE